MCLVRSLLTLVVAYSSCNYFRRYPDRGPFSKRARNHNYRHETFFFYRGRSSEKPPRLFALSTDSYFPAILGNFEQFERLLKSNCKHATLFLAHLRGLRSFFFAYQWEIRQTLHWHSFFFTGVYCKHQIYVPSLSVCECAFRLSNDAYKHNLDRIIDYPSWWNKLNKKSQSSLLSSSFTKS